MRKYLPRLRWLILIALFAAGLLAYGNFHAIMARSTWLIGELGTIDDDLTVLIVEGGDQAFELAARWREEAPSERKLAVVETVPNRLSRNGLQLENHERAKNLLVGFGVPAEEIVVIRRGAVDIDQKHLSICQWSSTASEEKVGILVSYLAVRGWKAQLQAANPRIRVIGLPNREYESDQWYRDQQGAKAYGRELLGYCYWQSFGEGDVAPEWDEKQWLENLAPAAPAAKEETP
jgi:hypothetical protein